MALVADTAGFVIVVIDSAGFGGSRGAGGGVAAAAAGADVGVSLTTSSSGFGVSVFAWYSEIVKIVS